MFSVSGLPLAGGFAGAVVDKPMTQRWRNRERNVALMFLKTTPHAVDGNVGYDGSHAAI